jgi:glycosyltransferase involved in cell wall biosynthesis
MEAPLITTIIPTFRRPALLRRAIASVLGQTYRNFRVCIYDNASGDETPEVVAQFAGRDSRVQYHSHPRNIGSLANFHFGLARVDTPYYSFLSDDDMLLPDFYATAMEGYRDCPQAGFVAGSVIVMSDQGEILAVPLDAWPHEGAYAPPEGLIELIAHKLPVWTSILFRKELTDAVGTLDLEVGAASDFDYQLKVAARAPFVISKKPCGIYVSHAASYTGELKLSTFWPGWLKMAANIASNAALPETVKSRARLGLERYITRTLFSVGLKLARAGNYADARAAATILREHFGERLRSLMLGAAARSCAASPGAVTCYTVAYDRAHALRARLAPGRAALRRKYGQYAKWL